MAEIFKQAVPEKGGTILRPCPLQFKLLRLLQLFSNYKDIAHSSRRETLHQVHHQKHKQYHFPRESDTSYRSYWMHKYCCYMSWSCNCNLAGRKYYTRMRETWYSSQTWECCWGDRVRRRCMCLQSRRQLSCLVRWNSGVVKVALDLQGWWWGARGLPSRRLL